ncbi:MAG: glycosyltransferase [Bacteroidales bacterium]|nr:glycosyltransferase [Bacteroidales bacterium]
MVTVIVIARNNEKTLVECLRSVESQFRDNNRWELIVVDGDSEDDTWNRAKNYLKRSAEYAYQVIINKEKSYAWSWNRGLEYARGDNILVVDADTVLPPAYIKKALKILQNRSDAGAVGGDIEYQYPGKENGMLSKLYRHTNDFHDFPQGGPSSEGIAEHPACPLYRRVLFEQLGQMDVSLQSFVELEFHHRISESGWKLWFNPELKVIKYAPRSFARLLGKITENYRQVAGLKHRGLEKFYHGHAIRPIIWGGSGIVLLILAFFNSVFAWLFLLFLLAWVGQLFFRFKSHILEDSKSAQYRLQVFYWVLVIRLVKMAGLLKGFIKNRFF